jgi:hypothetical protein
MVTKEELADRIKDRVVIVGTNLKHLESIAKYSADNEEFGNAFATLYISLQNSIYIELFKIFDTGGKDSKKIQYMRACGNDGGRTGQLSSYVVPV